MIDRTGLSVYNFENRTEDHYVSEEHACPCHSFLKCYFCVISRSQPRERPQLSWLPLRLSWRGSEAAASLTGRELNPLTLLTITTWGLSCGNRAVRWLVFGRPRGGTRNHDLRSMPRSLAWHLPPASTTTKLRPNSQAFPSALSVHLFPSLHGFKSTDIENMVATPSSLGWHQSNAFKFMGRRAQVRALVVSGYSPSQPQPALYTATACGLRLPDYLATSSYSTNFGCCLYCNCPLLTSLLIVLHNTSAMESTLQHVISSNISSPPQRQFWRHPFYHATSTIKHMLNCTLSDGIDVFYIAIQVLLPNLWSFGTVAPSSGIADNKTLKDTRNNIGASSASELVISLRNSAIFFSV